MTIKVKINQAESTEVERVFFKYNALLAVLSYLHNNSETYTEFLDKKLDEATELYIQLEQAKNKYSEKYKPEDMKNLNVNYTFDFDESQIIYEVADGE